MKQFTKTQQFGLYSAGIGAGVAAVAMLTDSLDVVQIIASTVLVLVGITLVVFGKNVQQALISLAILFVLLIGGFFTLNNYIYTEKQATTTPTETRTELSQAEKETRVTDYIRENISVLSTESEVLGGTFYVTDITFSGEQSGTVEYEDGHIALVADFTYTVTEDGGIDVQLTNAREPQL